MTKTRILFIDQHGREKFIVEPDREYTHLYEVYMEFRSSSGDRLRDIRVEMFFPPSDYRQKILDVRSNAPIDVREDNDNRIIEVGLDVVPPKKRETIVISEIIKLKPYSFDSWGSPYRISYGDLEIRGRLQNHKREEITRLISDLGLRNFDDPREIAIKVVSFLRSKIKYFKSPYRLGAMFALKHGKGSCDEISDLAIAILRACGIYARSVVGYILYEGLHEWLEIKTTQGWIPIDPTIGLVGGLGARWLKILVEQKPSMKLYRVFGKGKGTLDLRLIIDSREILHKKLTLTLKRK